MRLICKLFGHKWMPRGYDGIERRVIYYLVARCDFRLYVSDECSRCGDSREVVVVASDARDFAA